MEIEIEQTVHDGTLPQQACHRTVFLSAVLINPPNSDTSGPTGVASSLSLFLFCDQESDDLLAVNDISCDFSSAVSSPHRSDI